MFEQKVVLVTGASSGIGQAIARTLAQRGHAVFGTSRRPTAPANTTGVQMLPLDVRSDESVRACVDAVIGGAGRMDVLVNNAGYVLAGAIEEATMEQAKDQFETNFFGVMRMIKRVLPTMRKQGHGLIINVGSVAGLVPAPFVGLYNASKFAMEGFTETLYHELKPLNIRVSLIEPGFFKTDIGRNEQAAANEIRDYDPWRQRAFAQMKRFEENAPDPTAVARCVLRVVETQRVALRYRVGKDAIRYARLRRLLPESMFLWGTRRVFRLDAGPSVNLKEQAH